MRCAVTPEAVLDDLCARGPWAGKGHGHPLDQAWTLTAVEVRAYFTAIRDGSTAPWRTLPDCPGASGRKADRCAQLLRGVGLIRFDKETRRWVTS